MEVQEIKIDQLTPYDHNPRQNDGAVDAVAASIKNFGFKVPVVIDRERVIVAGHTRYKAAKKLGLESVPCIVADDLTDEQIRAFRLADNKVGELAGWDFDLLNMELAGIEELDMTQFGFLDPEEIEEPEEVHEVETPEDVQGRTVLGDVWELGGHRLICGDSTDVCTLDRLMQGEKADLVFTDPPYGMKKEADGVLNDNLNFDDLLEFNRQWVPLTFGVLKENGSWYCWGIDEPLMDIYANILKPMIKERQIVFRNLITWDKGSGQGQTEEGFRMYPTADEKCLFVMCGWDAAQGFTVNAEDYSESMDAVRLYLAEEIAKLGKSDAEIAKALGYKCGRTVDHWKSKSQFSLPTRENYEALRAYARQVLGNGDEFGKDYEVLKKDYEVLKKDYDQLKRDYDDKKADFYAGRAYFDNTHDNMNNVWHFDRTSQKERENTGGHATPKPIALCARAIKSSSREGEIVLDVFGGSGSTLIACEQLGRKCRMVELNPHYCDVIVTRWEKETGKEAVLVNGV